MKLILNNNKTILCSKSNYHVLKHHQLGALPQQHIAVYIKITAEGSSESILPFSQSYTELLHEAPALLQGC